MFSNIHIIQRLPENEVFIACIPKSFSLLNRFSRAVCLCLVCKAAVTNGHRLRGFRKHKFILLQFCQSEV